MGKSKGTSAISVREYIRDTYGQEGLERVMAAVDPETARMLDNVMPISWVPADKIREFYRIANKLLGDGTTALYRRIGAANAERDLPRFFKSLLALAGPEMVFGMFGMVWKMYYDTGQIKVIKKEPGFIAVEIKGFEDAGEEFCEDLCGYCETLLALIKLKNPRLTHTRCAGRGDESCIFEGRWDE
ncbi:MAG: hypothetical protein ACM3ZC_15970 [Bacteroidota bacterium]